MGETLVGERSDRYNHSRKGRRTHYRLVPKRLWQTIGILLAAGGLFMLLGIPFFYVRSWWIGQRLMQEATTSVSSRSPIHSQGHWPKDLMGVIQIPSLGLTAPILQGTQTAELNVAVGHLPTSVDPGNPGLSVLAGHDVTWFRHINRLKSGNSIVVRGRNYTYTFKVTHSAVVHVGTPVDNTKTASIVLEACYPLNALYLTPYRYLVWATLIKKSHATHQNAPQVPPNTQYRPINIPRAVNAQGLTLATNYLPMGHLTILGNPSPSWKQSNAPLNAADATTTLFLAALHIAYAHNTTWWHQFAPAIPYSTLGPLLSGQVTHYVSLVNETENVRGDTVESTQLQMVVDMGGGTPGSYKITLGTTVRGAEIKMASFQLQRVQSE